MKKSMCATCCLIALSLATPAMALDLTPHPATTTFNKIRVNRYFFEDAGKQMGFRIDNNMTVKGASASAAFKFDDLRDAGMRILKSSKKPDAPFDEKELESYRANARALVPASATDVQLDQEIPNVIAINGWTSHQFNFTYNLFGVAYRCSVTFLNYNKTEQLVVEVRAPAPDFERVYLRSYQVLNSLSELRNGSSGLT